MCVGAGLDLFDVARLDRAAGRPESDPTAAILTPAEREACAAEARPTVQAAVRFVVKEACLKALGTGLVGKMSWYDIEVSVWETGRAAVCLKGETARVAAARGVSRFHVAWAKNRGQVLAWAVADGPRHPHGDLSTAGAEAGTMVVS